jgi:hypothetical protein
VCVCLCLCLCALLLAKKKLDDVISIGKHGVAQGKKPLHALLMNVCLWIRLEPQMVTGFRRENLIFSCTKISNARSAVYEIIYKLGKDLNLLFPEGKKQDDKEHLKMLI